MDSILARDQGTTSARAILSDRAAQVAALAQKAFRQFFPQPGWVEHDANEIWQSQYAVACEVLAKLQLPASRVVAIGISNQRETTVLWDRRTGGACVAVGGCIQRDGPGCRHRPARVAGRRRHLPQQSADATAG